MISLQINKDDRILIIAPHPDDESIGCGGLLAKFPNQCDVLVVTDGARGSYSNRESEERIIRWKQFKQSMKVCGIRRYHCLGFNDGEMIGNMECFSNVDF